MIKIIQTTCGYAEDAQSSSILWEYGWGHENMLLNTPQQACENLCTKLFNWYKELHPKDEHTVCRLCEQELPQGEMYYPENFSEWILNLAHMELHQFPDLDWEITSISSLFSLKPENVIVFDERFEKWAPQFIKHEALTNDELEYLKEFWCVDYEFYREDEGQGVWNIKQKLL